MIFDRIRKQMIFMMAASFLSFAAFVLPLLPMSPLIPMILQGLSFSIAFPACWSSVPMVVPTTKVGTTFGAASCTLNIGLALTAVCTPLLMAVHWRYAVCWFIAASRSLWDAQCLEVRGSDRAQSLSIYKHLCLSLLHL